MFTTIKILLGKNATYDQEHLAGFFLKIEFVFSKHAPPPTHTLSALEILGSLHPAI